MALNNFKCNHLTPLCFKGLNILMIFSNDIGSFQNDCSSVHLYWKPFEILLQNEWAYFSSY